MKFGLTRTGPRRLLDIQFFSAYGVYSTTHGPIAVAHRINIMVHDDVWSFLRDVPQGQRSQTINVALREWARRRRRLDAAAEMDRLRNTSAANKVSAAEIVRWIREDRDEGH